MQIPQVKYNLSLVVAPSVIQQPLGISFNSYYYARGQSQCVSISLVELTEGINKEHFRL